VRFVRAGKESIGEDPIEGRKWDAGSRVGEEAEEAIGGHPQMLSQAIRKGRTRKEIRTSHTHEPTRWFVVGITRLAPSLLVVHY